MLVYFIGTMEGCANIEITDVCGQRMPNFESKVPIITQWLERGTLPSGRTWHELRQLFPHLWNGDSG